MSFNNTSANSNTIVPVNHTLLGWASRELGRWVYTVIPTKEATVEQKVLTQEDLSWSTSTDPRTNTQRMVGAMPTNSVMVGWHSKGGDLKYQIISLGNSKNPETEQCVFHIAKRGSTYATGMSTTQGGKGKTYSRILDGTRGIWNTNTSADTFSLAEDIDLEETPENQIFFTGDQGILESYISDEDTGEISLRPLEGYNVPKQEQDIQALQAEADSNKVITKIFKNESLVTIPYTQEHPVVEVFVLDGSETINGSGLTIIDDNTHKFSGVYNTVGSVSLYDNKWSTFSYHNAYKHVSENYYVVFDQSLTTWVILDTSVPHTSVGEDVGSDDKISLDHTGLLPESFGDYNITLSIDDISSLEFIKAEANTRIDSDAKTVIVDFGISKPSGKIVIK